MTARQVALGRRMPLGSLPPRVRGRRVAMLKAGARLDVWGASPSAPRRGSAYASAYRSAYGPAYRLGPGAQRPPEGRQTIRPHRAPASVDHLDRNVRVSPAGPETRVSRVRGHARRHPPERRPAGRSAGRAPGRTPTLEPAPPTTARLHATRPVASSFTAADS